MPWALIRIITEIKEPDTHEIFKLIILIFDFS